jgi:acetate---CoA ligase (ADP-forming)
MMERADLARLYHPEVVVVIGASEKEGSQPRGQWLKVRDTLGARGVTTIPVHPSLPTVLSTPAYTSVLDVPGEVDVAVIVVSDPLPALAECVERGVRFAIVFSAGFAEVASADGDRRQRELEALCGRGTRILGPNTNLNLIEAPSATGYGKRLGIVTQSGFQGRPIAQAPAQHIGIQSWTTLGNEVDIEFADVVTEYATWPEIGAIVGYVEGFKDGDRLREAADVAAASGVPVIVIKVGRSPEGRTAAAAHTAHLTGNDAVHDAVFRQHGIVRVDDIDELIEIGGMFCALGGPVEVRTGGVGIYALSGGSSAHVVDLMAAAGLSVPSLEQTTIAELGQLIPSYLQVSNPVDTGGTLGGSYAGVESLAVVAEDSNIDVVVVPITGVFPGMSDAVARDIVAVKERGCRTPILVVWSSPIRDDPTLELLAEARVPVFHTVRTCVRGIEALLDFSRRAAQVGRERQSAAPAIERRGAALDILGRVAPGGTLHEVDAKELLSLYGIRHPEEVLATTVADAVAFAVKHAGPLAMKVVSSDIPHKSDLGLVALDVTGEDAATEMFDSLLVRARASCPDARIEGILVSEMVVDAEAEILVGASRQEPFGLTVAVGLGGIFTEVLGDIALGVPPFDPAYARSMVEGLRGAAVLRGVRGRPPADAEAVVDIVLAVAGLCAEVGDEIEALDLNPILVGKAGAGAVAVDALVERRSRPA